MLYLRNKQTGEIKEVVPDSPEFILLKGQVGPDGRSLWEQTGDHHVGALAERAQEGALREEDLGAQDQPVAALAVDTTEVGPPIAPWTELTKAEREAGLTPESKAEQVAADIEASRAEERESTFQDAAERIAGDGTPEGFPVDTAEPVAPDATKDDLIAAAEARRLDTSGTKADLRERIEAHDNETANA